MNSFKVFICFPSFKELIHAFKNKAKALKAFMCENKNNFLANMMKKVILLIFTIT